MSSGFTEKKARSIAYKMLAACPRTCRQVKAALQKKGADESLAGQIVDELLKAGYLDDREFAVRYIAVRLENKPCGRLYFQGKLIAAGIDRALVEQVLCDAYPAEREKEEAYRFVRTLKERGMDCPQQTLRKLANRGFTGNSARYAVSEEFFAYLDITR